MEYKSVKASMLQLIHCDKISINQIIIFTYTLRMHQNYFFSNFYPFLNMQHNFPNFFPFPILNSRNQDAMATQHKPQPQSYTTKQSFVKQEQNLAKKEQQVAISVINQQRNYGQKKNRRNKSIFHNYQKHLVTTLKQKITTKQVREYDPQDECLRDLWHGFLQSKIANRTLILAVFGQQRSSNSQTVKYLEKCSLHCITEKYEIQKIKKSQGKIRELIKQNFSGKNLDIQLSSRKLPKEEKAIFKQYISYFLSQLNEGNISKRFPKRYKQTMVL